MEIVIGGISFVLLCVAWSFIKRYYDRAGYYEFMYNHYYKWHNEELSTNIKNKSLIKAQKEYIELLGNEIDDLVGIARVHGWESNNVEQGEFLREQIKELQ